MTLYITQGIHRAAKLWPDQIAAVCDADQVTWGKLQDRVSRFAAALRSLGLKPSDRVAMLSLNSTRLLEFYMAAPWGDLIMVTLNTRWAVAEMVEALRDAGAKALIVDDHFLDCTADLKAGVRTVKTLIHAGKKPTPSGMLNLELLLKETAPMADAMRGDHRTVALFYTGGTTGRAKGVMLSSATLVPTALQVQITSGMSSRSVVMQSAPLFHMAAGGMAYAALGCGARNVLAPRFEPDEVMGLIHQHAVTHVLWVPTMLQMIVDSPSFGRYDLGSLERIIYGAAPMPEALLRRAMERIPSARFTQYYGMTELSPLATVLGPDEHALDETSLKKLRSVGRAAGGVDLRVVDGTGRNTPIGEVGEVIVRSPGVMEGYWKQPELTQAAIRDGWMHTGDAGYFDADGYLFLVDRIKDMIISGGENVYSSEVENAIYQIPGVEECAVIGLPDKQWGEIVCAVVRLFPNASLTAEEIIKSCHSRIAGYKCPKRVIFVIKPLPKSGAGKIQKMEIRKEIASV